MSSPKKIGRWNRFEITFEQGERSNKRFCREAGEGATEEKRGLRKIEKKTSSTEAAPPVKANFSRLASASLWTEARRRAEQAKDRVELKTEGEEAENAESEERPPLAPRRPRTFGDASDA